MKSLKKIVPLILGIACFLSPLSTFNRVNATGNNTTPPPLAALPTQAINLTAKNTEAPESKGPVPTPAQYKYHKEELAAFCHFGPNTFTGKEWGDNYGTRPPSDLFRLTQKFDAETLVRTLKEAGFKRLIVTAKHHDGFAIWRSQHTTYDVESTPYQGDVLEEISQACTKYDMDMGLYLSPWDIHEPSYGYRDAQGNSLVGTNGRPKDGRTWEEVEELDVDDYNEFYDNQLIEILSNDEKYGNNGRFVEVWMDGAKGSGAKVQNYDFARWYATIQREEGKAAGKHTTDALLFGAQDKTTVRWIGNEWGKAPETNWSAVRTLRNQEGQPYDIDMNLHHHFSWGWEDGDLWTVPESDARITSGWFWGHHKKEPKTITELGNMYFETVGRNSPLLLNVPPNDKGQVDSAILQRIHQFAENIKNTFAENLLEGASVTASSVLAEDSKFAPNLVLDKDDDTYWTTSQDELVGTLAFTLPEAKTFDVVSIEETIKLGQRINQYLVEYQNAQGNWEVLERGTTVGAKRLVRLRKPVTAQNLRVTVKGGKGQPVVSSVGLFRATSDFSLEEKFPEGMSFIDNTDTDISDGNGFQLSQGWNQETGAQYSNGTNMWASGNNKTLTIKFTGTRLLLRGTKASNHGKMGVSIDGGESVEVNTKSGARQTKAIIFDTGNLPEGEHTLDLRVLTEAIGIEGAVLVSHTGGFFEFEENGYHMLEKDSIKLKIKRNFGSTGAARVLVQNNPGSAVQSDYDADVGGWIDFAEGETEKEITVTSKRNSKRTGDIYFTMDLAATKGTAKVGFNKLVPVHIKDADSISVADLATQLASSKNIVRSNVISGYATLAKAIEKAEEVMALPEANRTEKMIADAKLRLELAEDMLVLREHYTEESPYLFPTEIDEFSILEAEFAKDLINSGGPSERWKLNISTANWASLGRYVDSLNSSDRVTYPYYAAKPGTYEVVATYRSGNARNSLSYSEANSKITSASQEIGHNNSGQTRTKTFNLTVTEAGAGLLTLEGGSNGGPQLDFLKITLKSESGAGLEPWPENNTDEEVVEIDLSETFADDNQVPPVNNEDSASEGEPNEDKPQVEGGLHLVPPTADSSSDVSLFLETAPNSSIRLEVVKLNAENELENVLIEAVDSILDENAEMLKVDPKHKKTYYDVNVISTGVEEIEFEKYIIKFKLASTDEVVSIIHLKDDDSFEVFKKEASEGVKAFKVDGNFVTVETDSLSPFVLYTKVKEKKESSTIISGESDFDKLISSLGLMKEEKPAEKKTKDLQPNTSTSSNLVYILPTFFILAMFISLKKKRS